MSVEQNMKRMTDLVEALQRKVESLSARKISADRLRDALAEHLIAFDRMSMEEAAKGRPVDPLDAYRVGTEAVIMILKKAGLAE